MKQTNTTYRVGQKLHNLLMAITLSNFNRCSQFFHEKILKKICIDHFTENLLEIICQ